MLSEIINWNAVEVNLEAKDKAEVIGKLSELLLKDGSITSKEAFETDVYLREKEGRTGIGNGIAIPHGKSGAVIKTCIAVAVLKNGIPWETIDGKDVKVVILFAVNANEAGSAHVKLMAQVARLIAREEFCQALAQSTSKEDLVKLFS